MNKNEFFGNKYVPEYAGDYFPRPWYERDLMHYFERDLMRYFDYVDYQDMSKDPTRYFEKKTVINFDIIHYESRGDPLEGSYKSYQTVNKKDLEKYPAPDKKSSFSYR